MFFLQDRSSPNFEKNMDEGFSNIKSGQDDIKKHMQNILDLVVVGIKDNRSMDSNVIFMSNQNRCHDYHIYDHDRDLGELMGMVDIIKEDVMKLARINQCNHCQYSSGDETLPMEYVSITHPIGFPPPIFSCFSASF